MVDIDVSIDDDLFNQLKGRVDQHDISVSQGINNALKEYLFEDKENTALLIEKKDNEIRFLKDQLEKKETELKTTKSTLKARIRNKNNEITELEEKIDDLKDEIESKESQIKRKEKVINEKNNRINKLKDRNSELIEEINKSILSEKDIKGINVVPWIIIKASLKIIGK